MMDDLSLIMDEPSFNGIDAPKFLPTLGTPNDSNIDGRQKRPKKKGNS
jgi:hypothetical protein